MIKEYISCSEMKDMENAANKAGLSFYDMMENAGTCAFKEISSQMPITGKSIFIICGSGNNGGDGLVVARHMANANARVTVLLAQGEPKTPDALKNLDRLKNTTAQIINEEDFYPELCYDADIIVDALYGTGFHGELRAAAQTIISTVNDAGACGAFVAALDLPSGLPGDMHKDTPAMTSVKADLTLTFHSKKPVHMVHTAQAVCGDIIVCDIGIKKVLQL